LYVRLGWPLLRIKHAIGVGHVTVALDLEHQKIRRRRQPWGKLVSVRASELALSRSE
jgi:hypothetical protein